MKPRTFFSRRITRGAVLAVAAFALGCGDAPTSPVAARRPAAQPANADLLGGLLGGLTGTVTSVVSALLRPAPLAQDITVSKVIGTAGGTISIPEAGFKLIVPSGAVSSNTTFTVTALAGNMYAYEFGPHGMKFAKPLTFVQNVGLVGGLLSSLGPKGGYFADRSALDYTNSTATVSETIPAVYNLLNGTITFSVAHFSGYMVSSGKTVTSDATQ